MLEDEEKLISEKFKELGDFNQNCYEKHYGKLSLANGYIINAPELTVAETRTLNVMTMLLLDKEKYGSN